MAGKAPIFEKIYNDYLVRINRLDLKDVSQKTGCEWTGEGVRVPLFGKSYSISSSGILDPSGAEPDHSVKVVLCQYLLQHPASPPLDDTWISYKDFKDAAPLAHFHATNEKTIADIFEGRLKALKQACTKLGGHHSSKELNYDLHAKINALPKIPLLLLFNDSDDEFPAQCLLLFERRAEHYLDMECVAILGGLLTKNLKDGSTT
jgi:hypothetical protein